MNVSASFGKLSAIADCLDPLNLQWEKSRVCAFFGRIGVFYCQL